MPDQTTEQLLKERGSVYGDTWRLAGLVLGVLQVPFDYLLKTAPQFSHNWVLMLSKLIRILFSPYNVDHYDDIIGYATLCKKELEKERHDVPIK